MVDTSVEWDGKTTLSSARIEALKDMLDNDDVDWEAVEKAYKELSPTLSGAYPDEVEMNQVKMALKNKKGRPSAAANVLLKVLERVKTGGRRVQTFRRKPKSRSKNGHRSSRKFTVRRHR